MRKRHVIVELSHSDRLQSFAMAAGGDEGVSGSDLEVAAPKMDTLHYDTDFPAVPLPKIIRGQHPAGNVYDTLAAFSFDTRLDRSTYLVRGTVEEDAVQEFEREAHERASVLGIYSDMSIEPMPVCPGSAPVGDQETVAALLNTRRMHRHGMNGKGVMVAIVDSGVNMGYLHNHGMHPNFDAEHSWSWNPEQVEPGDARIGHGTMCAYDVCISAPKCTLLDIALLHPLQAEPGSSMVEALLSDAIRAYRHLINVLSGPRRPGELRSLVVNNSWGMFHPEWDWPPGHESNYSDNPNHPFTRIVATLERAGADILFAAGNCGAECPDSRCQGVTERAIYGANASAAVLCVAGVDTNKARVGYSAIGPGRLEQRKPDICGYTHFSGSGVYTADGGTSAACPVVAGVVAALRSKRPFNPEDPQTSPAAVRNLLASTTEDLGATGYDFQYGHGVIDGNAIVNKILAIQSPAADLCQRYPWLCDASWWKRILRNLTPAAQPATPFAATASGELGATLEDAMHLEDIQTMMADVITQGQDEQMTPEEMAYRVGYWLGRQEATAELMGEDTEYTDPDEDYLNGEDDVLYF